MTAPIITLCTDFGTVDGYVAQMKGVILTICPAAHLIDMTHDIPPQDIRAGAFVLASAAPRFPKGTIHVGVIDPGVGGDRKGMIIESAGHYFVGPDNGLFSAFINGGARAWEIPTPPGSSNTFHGRDVFAPAAARVASGEQAANRATLLENPVKLDEWVKIFGDGGVEGRVIHVDRFGNIITNLRPEDFPKGVKQIVHSKGKTPRDLPILKSYSQVEVGRPLWLVGSHGYYELAVRNDAAAVKFDVHRGDVVLTYS